MRIKSLGIAASLCWALSGGAVASETLTAATADVGSGPHYVISSVARAASANGVANIQVTEGQALTRVLLAVAKRDFDMGVVPQVANFLLARGLAMYQEVGKEQGAELAANVRAIVGFSAGVYHAITYEDSGIQDWNDLKGRIVFVGAPTGGAALQVQQMIKLITGYEPGTDYEAVKLDWGGDLQAMLDRKVDIIIRPGDIPAAYMDRLTASGKVRLIGVPRAVFESEAFVRFAASPGTQADMIPDGTYDPAKVTTVNAFDGGVHSVAIALAVAVNKNVDEELVYRITRAFIAGLPETETGAPWAKGLQLGKATYGMTPVGGLKLHAGAVRAWTEAGHAVPDHVREDR